MEREKITKGAEGLEKFITSLKATDGLSIPEYGCSRTDIAMLCLGKITPSYEKDIVIKVLEEEIQGCTNYEPLMHWLKNNPNTKDRLFKKFRRVRGSDRKKWIYTRVSRKWLIEIAIN